MSKKIDLTGRVFGRLTVIREAEKRGGRTYWLCSCECGNQKAVSTTHLTSGHTKSCSCVQKAGANAEDLRGKKFGRLRVLERAKNHSGRVHWMCLCDCGESAVISAKKMKSGHTKSCGCLHKENIIALRDVRIKNKEKKQKSIKGKKFGKLTPIKLSINKEGSIEWFCHCDCGNVKAVSATAILNYNVRSCGCLLDENRKSFAVNQQTHGLSNTREYGVWCAMHSRCYNPNNKSYKHYGARGIEVCERWHRFENYISDMGARPIEGHSIDRIDVNGDYSPENCRYASAKTQANNTRKTIYMEIDGQTKPLTEWAEIFNIKSATVRNRLRKGWADRDALTKPAH